MLVNATIDVRDATVAMFDVGNIAAMNDGNKENKQTFFSLGYVIYLGSKLYFQINIDIFHLLKRIFFSGQSADHDH